MAQISYGTITVTDVTDGANANIWTTTVAPATPNYTFTISNLTGSNNAPRVGDIILYGVYRYTITIVNSTTVVAGNRQSLQGASGAPGGKWYTGTSITGTSTSPTIFSGSGISNAVVGDMYLNTSTDNVYQCTVEGNASTAKWIYTGNIKGNPGNQGRSVTKVETEYYRKNSGGSAPTSSTAGSTTVPEYIEGCTYYTRTVTYFDSGDPDRGAWVEDTTKTNEIKNAYDAWIAAGAAELKVAKIVNNSEGVAITSGVNGGAVTPGTPSTYGYNTMLAPNYLGLRYNAINLAKLTTTETTPALEFYIPTVTGGGVPTQGKVGLSITATALTFYNPTDSSNTRIPQLIIGTNGAIQSGNYSYTEGQIFSSTGTKIDLINGTIYSPYFRILTSTLGTNQPGAYIKGDVIAQTGRFGNSDNNYWLIDTYYDANEQEYYSSLRGIGKSFIQLGSTNTWTLGTSRINSSWRYISTEASGVTNPFLLRYKRFGTTSNDKYYDYGMNIPTILNTSDQKANRIADKFLYIRTANYVSDNNLSNLELDSSWTYPFYVDSQGNVRATAFYVGSSDTPIGGGAGTVAERLTQGYGSASQPIYFNSSGVPTNTTYTLNAAGAKGVVTDLANNTASTDLPTAAAVASYVTSRGYITSYTDNKVQTSQANTTKIYLAGTSTTGTSTGTLSFDSNVYLTTTAGTLHATTFEGDLSGTASRAIADSDGNTIKTTYLKLSGGNVTGAVTFGSSVSIDELTAGDLVVNGNASFTNNIQANTINGVAVGTSPKFTDSEVSTLTLASGSTAGTALTYGGKFTLTVGSKTVSFTMPSSDNANYYHKTGSWNGLTYTAAKVGSPDDLVFTIPTGATNSTVAIGNHTHGNITSGGDITATAPTIVSGDQIIINDDSASKITNGPTFDGSTTTTALTPKGTWEAFSLVQIVRW